MRHLVTAWLCIAPAVSNVVLAEIVPAPGQLDSRVRSVAYDAAQVYRLRGVVGFEIDLEFDNGEVFEGLAGGDLAALGFVASGSHLFLKPKAARVATNLTVLTNHRAYHISYSAVRRSADWPNRNLIYAVRFEYPGEASPAQAAAVLATRLAEGALERPHNVAYAFCGRGSVKPTAVFDDGVRTTFQFPVRAELPVIFVRDAEGAESLVNLTVEKDGITVQRIAPAFVLRRGRLVGCVRNLAFEGAGTSLPSGTVSQGVTRETRGDAP